MSSDPAEVMRAIPQMVRRIAPGRALFGMRTMSEHLTESLDKPRLNAGVLAVFAASALLSAAVGLYGLVTLIVVARTREIGVRMAVGATPAQVVRQVLGEALRPLGVAILIGGALAFAAVRALQSVLFGVAPGDLTTFVFVCGVLLSVAAIAALVPGRRAARIDPVEALRAE